MSNKPEDLRYTKEHEWLKLDGESAYIGITEYAAEQLGDVVHVELPQPNDEFNKDEAFGVVESVKSVSDMYMPVSAKVIQSNESLLENAGIINEEPYNEGWIVKILITEPTELEDLMTHDQYKEFINDEL
ncbi:glycine cleavage system protein H [bacterium K02(2017)]|nr:glycine cleavage system protein H [bacterium K02(2017)]